MECTGDVRGCYKGKRHKRIHNYHKIGTKVNIHNKSMLVKYRRHVIKFSHTLIKLSS